ncbi:MAG TPA: SRPBCC family protein [Pyrinomonadaceae bacterium]|jgi:uncharacterized protein YndB with AHSA1/START domain
MRRYERLVEVDAPVERVFDLFADFEAAPRWVGGVRGVRRVGRRTFLWVAETALGLDVEWEAEVVVFAPDRRVVWRSVGGDVRADCEAVFSVTPEGTTLVRVVRGFETPGGRSGRDVARFFGRRPGEQLEEDLARFRRLAERTRRREGVLAAGPDYDDRARGERRHAPDARERERPRAREPRGAGEEPRARYAMTPRERQRERERAWEESRAEEQRRAAGWYLRRGVDRLLEHPPDDRARRGRS